MATIAEVRQKYPQYNDLSDEQLGQALHKKYYADMPYDEFAGKIGLSSQPAPAAQSQQPPALSTPQVVANVGIGAAKEAGSQIAGLADVVRQGFTTPVYSPFRQYSPEQVADAQQWAQGIKTAVANPVDTARGLFGRARDAVSSTFDTLTTRPQTAEQAQNYGATALKTAEVAYGGAGAVKAGVQGVASIPAVGRAAERVAVAGEKKAALAAAEAAPKNELIKEVRGLGLRLTPQHAGGTVGKAVEGVSGSAKLERVVSRQNAKQVRAIVAKDVGLDPAAPLTDSAIQSGIKSTLVDYTAPRKLGRVKLADDAEFQTAIKDVENITAQEMADFPDDVSKSVRDEVAKFNVPSADAGSIVTKVAKLRERASANFRAGDASSVELARAQRKLATALEDAVERHGVSVGQTGVIDKFRAARQRLAKLYDVRDSLTEAGDVDLGVLARKLDRDEPLSGNLRTLARAKKTFDRSFQNPDKIRNESLGFLDAGIGVAGAATINPYFAAAALTRPLLRSALASRAGQAATIGAKEASPSLLTRSARAIANQQNALWRATPENALLDRR